MQPLHSHSERQYTIRRSYLKSINIIAFPILMLLIGVFFIKDMFVDRHLFEKAFFAFWFYGAFRGIFESAKLPETIDIHVDGSILIIDQIKREQRFNFSDIREITNRNGLIAIITTASKFTMYGKYDGLTRFLEDAKSKNPNIITSGI